eukprot:g22210.t1
MIALGDPGKVHAAPGRTSAVEAYLGLLRSGCPVDVGRLCTSTWFSEDLRTKYDVMTGACEFDHFCNFTGCAIGRGNHRAFLVLAILEPLTQFCYLFICVVVAYRPVGMPQDCRTRNLDLDQLLWLPYNMAMHMPSAAMQYPFMALVSILNICTAPPVIYLLITQFFMISMNWTVNEFDDAAHLKTSELRFYDGQLLGMLHQSKTSGAGKRVRELPLFIARDAYVVQDDWLAVGFDLIKLQMPRDRVYVFPEGCFYGTRYGDSHVTYAEAVSGSARTLALLDGYSGRLIPSGWERFWSGRGERATLPSGLAAPGVEKADRDYLGRWCPEGSNVYVRTYNAIVKKMQKKMVGVLRGETAYEDLDEGSILEELKVWLSEKWTVPEDQADSVVEAWKEKLGAKGRPQAVIPLSEDETTIYDGSQSDVEDGDQKPKDAKKRKIGTPLEEEREGGYVVVAVLTDAEGTKAVEAAGTDLKYLFSRHEVSVDNQKLFYHHGVTTLEKLSNFAKDREDLTAVLKEHWELDAERSLDERVQVSAIVCAFSNAKTRSQRAAEVDAEYDSLQWSRPVVAGEWAAMRSALEKRYGHLEDKIYPAKEYIEKKLAEVESGEYRAEELTEIVSKEESEPETVVPIWDSKGRLAMKKGSTKVQEPANAEELRKRRIRGVLSEKLGVADQGEPEPGQPFFLDLLKGVLEKAGDPDWRFLEQAKSGLPLGVLQELPRTPDIFEEQVKWSLEGEDWGEAVWQKSNYLSAEEHEKYLVEHLEQEVAEGLMVKMIEEEFIQRFGENRAVAALAVLVEDELTGKKRVIHDGTHGVMVNHRIRCRDKVRMPGPREKRALLEEYEEERLAVLSLVGDFAKAHRRFKYAEEEQGFLACKAATESEVVYVNQVGTFGIASTPYWWARLSAALMRVVYWVLGDAFPNDMLLYADDLEVLTVGRTGRIGGVLAFALMAALGAPFK